MSGADKLLTFFIIPNLLLIISIVWIYILVGDMAAWLTSTLGTPAIMAANLVYIVFFYSKKRWPGLTARQRTVKVLTFQK